MNTTDTKKMTLCVDFDGTCVEHKYPDIGKDVPFAATILKQLADNGYKIILYTMRSYDELEDAVKWFKKKGIELWGVNENPTQRIWTNSPKIYAHLYIDDAALGVPLMPSTETLRPMVNWLGVFDILVSKYEMDFLRT